ncbi:MULTISPECIES: flavodoxin [Pseudonocardia]|jgi:hypothetical protein|uniref:flavodoxin n=1 Tax=Pseudonocardia TaxID=1847 RepID=UPI0018F88A6C|nr:flavodoxin [Pseudonocardia dioxanivorans]GJF03011.1 flavodoxin [Pseudonocardia sp. D17]
MRALVVHESVFDNTRDIARAVADGLSIHLPVTVCDVTRVPRTVPADVGVLVVGGPTHVFGMTRPDSRRDAATQAADDPDRIGIRLADLDRPQRVVSAAAFDTRVRHPRLPGSAAHRALARLRRLGFLLLDEPTSFWVAGTPGPLLDGEVHRAYRWGEQVGARMSPPALQTSPPEPATPRRPS